MLQDYCIIGLGKFGIAILDSLISMKKNVVAIDINKEKINLIAKKTRYAFSLDATNLDDIQNTSIENIKTVIVSISALEMSVLTCLNLKDLGIKNIVAKATSDNHEKILKSIGVNHVIRPEIEVARQLINRYAFGIDNKIDELESHFTLIKVMLVNPALIGKPIKNIKIRSTYIGNIIYIKRGKEIMFPHSDLILQLGDVVVLIAKNKTAKALQNYFENRKNKN